MSAQGIATDEGKNRSYQKVANPKKCHRGPKFPGIHGILQVIYPKIHAGRLTPA